MTPDAIARRIASVSYELRGDVTVCRITVDNGWQVHAESFCAAGRPFRTDVGRRLAYERASARLAELFAFADAERRFRDFAITPQERHEQHPAAAA